MFPTSRDRKFIDIVFAQASSLDRVGGARIGAAIVYKGRIVAFGRNQKKSDPFQAQYGKNGDSIYLHAELNAIKNALRLLDVDSLSRCTLYVARAKNIAPDVLGYGIARPCKGCMRAIADFNIKRVVYTTDEQTLGLFERKG